MKTNVKNIAFIIVLLTITVVCFSLGIWQVNRYSQKLQLDDTASTATEVKIDEIINRKDYDSLIGQTVQLTGDFIASAVFKLDNRMLNATYGVEIFSLFREQTSSKVYLVNMGWFEIGNKRDRLERQFDFTGIHNIHARIGNIPSRPPFINEEKFRDDNLHDLWLFVNKTYLEKQYSLVIEPLVFNNMTPPDELKYRDDSKDSNAIMHILYAIQWFLFSFFALFGLMKIKK